MYCFNAQKGLLVVTRFQKRSPQFQCVQFTGQNLSDFTALNLTATLLPGTSVPTISVSNPHAVLPPHEEYPNGVILTVHLSQGDYLVLKENGEMLVENGTIFPNVYTAVTTT